jgi:hypothetical protein
MFFASWNGPKEITECAAPIHDLIVPMVAGNLKEKKRAIIAMAIEGGGF